jgi:polyphosphate kinase
VENDKKILKIGLPYLQNRDRSWLNFNKRVVEEANDTSVPLFERLKFISIYQSNLQEFFMIRVGSLKDVLLENPHARDTRTGQPIEDVIKSLYKTAKSHLTYFEKTYRSILKELDKNKIKITPYSKLSKSQKRFIERTMAEQIKPLLSPQVIDENHPFPSLNVGQLYVGLNLKRKEKESMGLLPVPTSLPMFYVIQGKNVQIVLLESIVEHMAKDIFVGYDIKEKLIFSITRNADLNWDEQADAFYDARMKVKKLLQTRNRQSVLRLVTDRKISSGFINELLSRIQLKPFEHHLIKTPLHFSFVFQLEKLLSDSQKGDLLYPPLVQKLPPRYQLNLPVKEQVFKHDLMSFYPYNTMQPFLRLLKEAASDPEVVSIKITVYRLGKTAKLVEYLSLAAENGKDVLVIIELRARFDEKNNIDWSERLELAGCRIIYGLDYLKIHSKICVITYRGKNQNRFITQIGTGNYNEKTVEQYTDISLMTSHHTIGLEALTFFQTISMNATSEDYHDLVVSPFHLKRTFLSLIEEEKKKGKEGRITFKLNSLTDVDFAKALQEASQAGVIVRLNVRGICCLVPQVPGWTDNVFVHSVVGRFLEHGRVYIFGDGESSKVFIASADLMTRNTERRMEVGVPIYDKPLKHMLVQYVELYFKDNVKGRIMNAKGLYERLGVQESSQIMNAQQYLLESTLSDILKT